MSESDKPSSGRSETLRDLAGFLMGAVLWAGILSLPWMQGILATEPFLLWPLIPLIVFLSGLVSLVAVRYRFLAANASWVTGLMIAGGLSREVFSIGTGAAIRAILYSAAWYALLYAPVVMLGVWVVDRVRGDDAA